jgi:ABC-type amino acid transport substrate-binding protein
MYRKLLSIICVFFAAVVVMVLVPKDRVDRNTTMIMGTSTDYPPFEFAKQGVAIGFEIDLMREATKRLGYELKIQDMEFSGIIPSLKAGRIDFGASGFTQTEARRKAVAFSKEYYKNPMYMLHASASANKDRLRSFDRVTVAAQLGTLMNIYLLDKQAQGNKINVIALHSNLQILEELKLGRIDGMVVDKSIALKFAENTPGLECFELADSLGSIAAVFPKDSDLVTQFDQVLDDMQLDGTLETLIKKWF